MTYNTRFQVDVALSIFAGLLFSIGSEDDFVIFWGISSVLIWGIMQIARMVTFVLSGGSSDRDFVFYLGYALIISMPIWGPLFDSMVYDDYATYEERSYFDDACDEQIDELVRSSLLKYTKYPSHPGYDESMRPRGAGARRYILQRNEDGLIEAKGEYIINLSNRYVLGMDVRLYECTGFRASRTRYDVSVQQVPYFSITEHRDDFLAFPGNDDYYLSGNQPYYVTP